MQFKVYPNRLKNDANEIRRTRAQLFKIYDLLESVGNYLYSQDAAYRIAAKKLRQYQSQLAIVAEGVGRMGTAADNISDIYRRAEIQITMEGNQQIKRFIDRVKSLLDKGRRKKRSYAVSSILFDEYGRYGGDQGSPKGLSEARRQELYNLIRKNNPGADFSDSQLEKYLKKMNSEGCNYVALVNSIFVAYEGRPEAFRKAFGYPMYYKGDLNYDMLLTDLYSTMDNKGTDGSYDEYHDYTNFWKDGLKCWYDPRNDESGTGTTIEEGAYYLKEFMAERNVDVKVNTYANVTPENFRALSESGKQVVMYFFGGDLLNMNGSVAQTINGGHAMMVTGVTESGMLVVSSWGNKYMIDPKGTYGSTEIYYSTIEY